MLTQHNGVNFCCNITLALVLVAIYCNSVPFVLPRLMQPKTFFSLEQTAEYSQQPIVPILHNGNRMPILFVPIFLAQWCTHCSIKYGPTF